MTDFKEEGEAFCYHCQVRWKTESETHICKDDRIAQLQSTLAEITVERDTFMRQEASLQKVCDSLLLKLQEAQAKLDCARKALDFYAAGAERVIERDGKKHWVREFGCGCCAQSYDVDDDGERGAMNCDMEDVSGMMAREAIAELGAPASARPDTSITWPTHKCGLHLTHNQHKDYYQRIDQYVSAEIADNFKDDAARQRAIASDEVWELQWYPRTPVGFNLIAAPTLAEALAWASEIEQTEKDDKDV